MDPNLFELNWGRTFEAVTAIIVLSFIVERVAALLFESRFFLMNTKIPSDDSKEALREAQSVATARDILDLTQPPATTATAKAKVRSGLDAIATSLKPSSALWPLDPTDPARAQQRAKEVLDRAAGLQQRRKTLGRLPLTELGAILLAWAVCSMGNGFDAVAIILLLDETSWQGQLLTAAVIAGGGKASIKLFHDLLGVRSTALNAVRPPEK